MRAALCARGLECVDMDQRPGEIVLLTGASGFLGRHVLKHLLEQEGVAEVRALDKAEIEDCEETEKLRLYRCDLLDAEACREAFRGADVVMHCAGLVDYRYPPDVDSLRRNNVDASENVVRLCVQERARLLVHCSTTEVTLQPASRFGVTASVIYKTESKLEAPEDGARLMFGEYAASKLRAERIVLKANNTPLSDGGVLLTTALRPTLLYGEGDPHLLPEILRFAKHRDLPRLCGLAGKQQMTYVGNAAWAFIRAHDTLKKNPKAIAGLPVNVTDDTLVENLARFCERVTRSGGNRVKVSNFSVPFALSYLGALVFELLIRRGFVSKLKIPPRSMVAYLGSSLLYSRARASIHMNYWPKYNTEETLTIARKYYGVFMKL
ncbi:3 beta-hydroxysteroid dehydrogenase/Delta 5--_4-isomerase type 1 [Copidosoma floridanum]|uniref:3 beta-hydroxysteroid dehydrogenase/Delta 5-->4-isomerase type 1 n=1 Tax=Copidosoma floridanum TaxID=29053 RepID=UPI000C6F4F2C|nr:3 beta-hydroxysteroid dehydrogenase/Delta 5-->4-isomerase type 1 [Copidosoma floridanum]